MEPNQARRLPFLKMTTNGIPDIGAQCLPGIRLRDDGMPEGTGDETALGFFFAALKDDLAHGFNVSRGRLRREVWPAPPGGSE